MRTANVSKCELRNCKRSVERNGITSVRIKSTEGIYPQVFRHYTPHRFLPEVTSSSTMSLACHWIGCNSQSPNHL